MKRISFLCLVIALLFAGAQSTLAANESAGVYGEVGYYLISGGSEDAGPASKAKVTLQNEKGDVIGTTETDAQGKYSFANVNPGKYKVSASYRTYTNDFKNVNVGTAEKAKVKLEVYSVIDQALADYLKFREQIGVYINNERKWFEQPPVLMNDTTLVPMRAIFEELGAQIAWDEVRNAATATKGDVTIEIVIDSDKAAINGEPVTLAEKAQLINDKTMVPLRFVSEALGAKVEWDGVNNEVLITLASESIESDYDIIGELIKGTDYTAKLVQEDKLISIKQGTSFKLEYRRQGSTQLLSSAWLSNLDDQTITLGKSIIDKFTGQDATDLVATVKKLVSEKKAAKVTKNYNGHEVQIELMKIVDTSSLRITF